MIRSRSPNGQLSTIGPTIAILMSKQPLISRRWTLKPRISIADDHYDLVVWNRDIVTLKNTMSALCAVRRVLRPGGFLILAVPNLAAAHNRLLLLGGRQPTTLHISLKETTCGALRPHQ